jgi:hypothetical protein
MNNATKTFDQVTIDACKDLFQFSSPEQLRKSLIEIFFCYLCNTKPEVYNANLNNIASDYYFLIKFLEEMERQNSTTT